MTIASTPSVAPQPQSVFDTERPAFSRGKMVRLIADGAERLHKATWDFRRIG